MNRYSVADARKRMASVLDKAEQGELPPRAAPTEIEILDADVESGQWTWDSRGKLVSGQP